MTVVYEQRLWNLDIKQEVFEELKKEKPLMEVTITELKDTHSRKFTVMLYELEDYFYYRNPNKKPSN